MVADRDIERTLSQVIAETPIIDNHAHPLLVPSALGKWPLLAIATEASGDALDATFSSLAHIRSVNQLARVLGCEPTWDAVEQGIRLRQTEDKVDDWTRRCLQGIHCVLVDDGLDNQEEAKPYTYFDEVTPGKSKRIVRIEPIAAELIEKAYLAFPENHRAAYDNFEEELVKAIRDAIADPEVVGFKSVICYRTGLDIPRHPDEDTARRVFEAIHKERSASSEKFKRLDHSGLNQHVVHLLCQTITATPSSWKKPIQFHTGLGDNDITLTKSSASHLQEAIRAYPLVPFVLLHGGYPWTRELGYLAGMYANAWADVGEVFPFLSRDGQEGVVRQVLELCPSEKILWSTDGHWFPETYFVAVEQVREVLGTVLADYVRKGDLTLGQATRLVEDVFYNNSNKLYNLGLEPLKKNVTPVEEKMGGQQQQQLQLLAPYLNVEEPPKFLAVYWNDMTSTPRMRAVPIKRILSTLSKGEQLSFGVTEASLGLTQADMTVEGVAPAGEFDLHPDFSTLRPGPKKGYLSARGVFKHKDGSPVSICPRTVLTRTLDAAKALGLTFTVGFEIEFVLMERGPGGEFNTLIDDGHAWSAARAMDHDVATTVVEKAVLALEDAGVDIDMVHPESAPGQYEIVLSKAPALEAVDTLLYARDVISHHATAAGYRMTLHPKPFPTSCGTASHMHLSIDGHKKNKHDGGDDDPKIYEPFYAGVLRHLRAIAAFTYSNVVSYDRVVDGAWAGGTYIGWGTQNRETPLRKIAGSHWEIKCVDGLANAYLALAAVVAAGSRGVRDGEEMTWGDCGGRVPAEMGAEAQAALGITTRIPGSLGEALEALREDGALVEAIGGGEGEGELLLERYMAVKGGERKLMKGLGGEERRRWIMERY